MATYTNFCCRSGGSNLNAGTLTGNTTEPGTSASFSYASGNWVASTGVFTVASGNPSSDGVAVGDFASVYADGSTVTGFVGRITARTTTTITVSLTAVMGAPPTDGTGNRTLKVGGAWAGPATTVAFPFDFAAPAATNVAANPARVNFKNAASFAVTAAMTHSLSNMVFQGYTTAYGDGGLAIIDGGTSGAAYSVLTLSGSVNYFLDVVFQNNGATGSTHMVNSTGTRNVYRRCQFKTSRGNGILAGLRTMMIECLAEGNNQNNTASQGGFAAAGGSNGCWLFRCVARNNTGSNTSGFVSGATGGMQPHWHQCVADTNGLHGFLVNDSNGSVFIRQCASYDNGTDGIRITNSANDTLAVISGCVITENGGYGVGLSGTSNGGLYLVESCAFLNNTSGQVQLADLAELVIDVAGSVTLSADPFVDAPNANFALNNTAGGGAACRGVGAGTTAGGETVGYPDLGAAQHQEVASTPPVGRTVQATNIGTY